MMGSPLHSREFEDAIAVRPEKDGRYSADLKYEWSAGNAPHGGYIIAILYRLVVQYFKERHQKLHNQDPWPIGMQLTYLRRSDIGPANLSVKVVKLGLRTSSVHVRLSQGGNDRVVGYVTVSDTRSDVGLSLPSNWKLEPPITSTIPPQVDDKGEATDGVWLKRQLLLPRVRRAAAHTRMYIPADKQRDYTFMDQWCSFCPQGPNGGLSRWTPESAVYLLDLFAATWLNIERASTALASSKSGDAKGPDRHVALWFPAVTVTIDFKKRIPPEGLPWLFSRITVKSVKNGRLDMEVVQMDENGELVAVMSQIAMVMSASRSMGSAKTKL